MSKENKGSALQEKKFHYAWFVLAVGTFVVFGALGLARFGYSLLLPSMQSALELDNSGAGVLATSNLTGYLVLALIGGALAARYGPRLVVSLGMACIGIAMLFTGAANSYFAAGVWRMITGVGSGASNVPVMALMSAWFGPNLRGLATGITATGSSIALIVTGPLVPRMLKALPDNGWRVTWYLFGGFSLVLAVVSALLLRNSPEDFGLTPLSRKPVVPRQKSYASGKLQWSLVYRSKAVWHLGAVYAAFGFSYIIYMTFFVRYRGGEPLHGFRMVQPCSGPFVERAVGPYRTQKGNGTRFCNPSTVFCAVCSVAAEGWSHRFSALVRYYFMEHSSDHGSGLRRCSWTQACACRIRLRNAFFRHWPGCGSMDCRSDRRCIRLFQRLVSSCSICCCSWLHRFAAAETGGGEYADRNGGELRQRD